MLGGVTANAAQQLIVHSGNSGGSFAESLAVWVLSNRNQYFPHGPFDPPLIHGYGSVAIEGVLFERNAARRA
jgi:hypothetical protein